MSGSNNQAFNVTIPRNCGNADWEYYDDSGTNWLWEPESSTGTSASDSGLYSIYTISMPFEVSKIKITLTSYPSYSDFGWLNRDDRNSFTSITSANSYYKQGDSFNISVNSAVVLMQGTTTYSWSTYKYVLKLFPGYLMYGGDMVRNTSSNSLVRLVMREIGLNIIAYR